MSNELEGVSRERLRAIGLWMLTASKVEIHDYAFAGSPRCDVCGRVVADDGCEDDPELCWLELRGGDPHCQLLRTPVNG